MPYQKETHKVLSGSLNLLAPTDQIPESDAIALSNFRTDTAGSIRSRVGHGSAIYSLGSAIHSLITGLGVRYQGAGTAFYRNGSSVATGLDGNNIGLASFKKYVWMMNKSSQKKDDGTNNRNWGIAAPAGAPTVSVGAELTTTVETFESSGSWTASSGLTLANDGADKKQGSNSLQISMTAPGVYSISKTGLSLNLNSVGGQTGSDDDKHRIWVKIDSPKAIQSLTFILAVESSATFDTDYYVANIHKKHWKKKTGWVLLELRRASTINDVLVVSPSETNIVRDIINPRLTDRKSVDIGDLPSSARALISQNTLSFERVGSTSGRDWSTVTGLKIELEVTGDAGTTIRLDGWEVFGSVNGSIEGRDVQYCFTYVNADGHESNPSPLSTATRFNRRAASLSGLTDSADGQVTGKYIYRTGGTLGGLYRVNSVAVAQGVTTYADTSDDEDLYDLDILAEDDNDLPPAAAGLIGPFFGRLIAFNSTANPNRFWWSKQNKPHAFPGAASSLEGQWADIGDSGYAILAATHHDSIIHFWKADSMYYLVGDPDGQDGIVQKANMPFGTAGPLSVCRVGSNDAILGPDGIYLANRDGARKISQKIDPIFKGLTTTIASGVTIPPLTSTAANRAKSVLAHFNSTLYFSYCESGQSTNNVTLRYDFESDCWFQDTRGWGVLYDEAGTLLGGTSGGAVHQLESGASDAGSAIPLIYQSKYLDFGAPDALKTIEDIVVEADTGGATLTLSAYKDNGTALTIASTATFSTSAGTRSKFIFQLDAEGEGQQVFNVSLRITGNANTSTPTIIYGMWVHYYPEARNASSYDTDESLLGSPQVKLIRQIKLDIDNPSDATPRVYTDLPGGAMTLRETLTAITGSASGRRMVSRMFTSQYQGYLGRLVVDSAAMRVYGAYAEVKDVGDYVLANEVWSSDEVDLGSSKVKTVRAIKLDLENQGAVSVFFESDLPNGMAVRYSVTPASTGSRRVLNIPLDAEYKGYLFRVKVSSASDWTLYGAELEAKEIGTYVVSGKTYNSDALDFGSNKVKRIRGLKVELEQSADVTLVLQSDLPGGVLATRDTKVIANNANRRTVHIPLDAEREGYLFKITASSSADFTIHSIEAETVEVGTYIAGSSSKIWDSGVLDWGTERVKLIKEVEVDLISSATVTLNLLTDQPTGTITSRTTKTIASTSSARKTAKIRLEDGYKGRLFQFKLSTSATDFTVEAVRVLIKLVGEPGATAWIWVTLPVVSTRQGEWGWVSAPLEETSRGIWAFASLPVVKTGSNAWRWESWGRDAVA